MKRASAARTAAVVIPLALSLLPLSPLAACKQDNAVAKGGDCYLATDCAPGLVCVPQKNGTRVCSDDLSGLGKPPAEAGAGGDAGDAGDAARDAPAATDGPVVEPPETGPPDAGKDTGAPPLDAAEDG